MVGGGRTCLTPTETPARGASKGGDTWFDFTVGSVFTWRLDSSKTYTTTWVTAGSIPASQSRAKLTASVIPDDGGLSMAEAAAGGGFKIRVDPSDPNLMPQRGKGDLAWCGGIGNFVNPSQVRGVSLVRFPSFPIKYAGTCYDWVSNSGYTQVSELVGHR